MSRIDAVKRAYVAAELRYARRCISRALARVEHTTDDGWTNDLLDLRAEIDRLITSADPTARPRPQLLDNRA